LPTQGTTQLSGSLCSFGLFAHVRVLCN